MTFFEESFVILSEKLRLWTELKINSNRQIAVLYVIAELLCSLFPINNRKTLPT